jgi:multidrug efflux pump subunit AcrB
MIIGFISRVDMGSIPIENAFRFIKMCRIGIPIILTSMTAIGGLLPIALSTNPLISPLADVLIGGLVSSTLLSRVITPVVYKLLPPTVELEPVEVSSTHT